MSGRSHGVEIEEASPSSHDDLTKEDDSSFLEEALTPGENLPAEFYSCCSESLSSRQSLENDWFDDPPSLWETSAKPAPPHHRSGGSSQSSVDGSSTSTLQPRAKPRDLATHSRRIEEFNDQGTTENENESDNKSDVQHLPSIHVSTPEDLAEETKIPIKRKLVEQIYVGGLKAIREADSDSARSPNLESPTVPNSNSLSNTTNPQQSVSVLDRFGRKILLHRNEGEGMEEVRVDEDGNYYVFGDEGFRVRLKPGQIESGNTSQPFCISNGQRVNIHVVADKLRTAALQAPRPAADEPPITPRTEPTVSKRSVTDNAASRPNIARNSPLRSGTTRSRNPWSGIFTGVAEKSKHATTYITKRARSKTRSSTSQPANADGQQPNPSRTSSRTLSAKKSALETRDTAESQGSQLPFRSQGPKSAPVGNIKKRIMARRS